MKKLIVIAAFGLTLMACNKTSLSSSNKVSANVDGTNYNISQQMSYSRSKLPNDSTEYFTLNGVDGSGDYMEVDVKSKHSLTTRAYTQLADSSELVRVAFSKSDNILYYTIYSATNPSTVTITNITGTEIQGTFVATLYDMGNVFSTPKTVTNGSFTLSTQ
jgi:uncharacterized protein YxeA